MGCALSKEDAEGGTVSRCQEQKHHLRAAVAARHALAGAHAGHAAALRNVGAALSDYAAGENDLSSAAAAAFSRSASAPGPAAATNKALPPPPPPEAVLPPPPPPDAAAAPLVRSLSAPDLPLGQTIKKKSSGEAAIMEEVEEGDAEGGADDERRRAHDDDLQAPPPPPPPTNYPPPSRSPPPVPPPEEPRGNSWVGDFIFGSRDDAMPPPPPPTLDPAAAEASWAAERRGPGPPPPPKPETEQQQPPPPTQPQPDDVAEGKKLMTAEPVVRRAAATQKAARKAEGKKGRAVVMAPPQPARVGDVLRRLDDHFLRASESAHEVSKMLEAARMHYHSNFAATRGFVDHSARVMQVITWNRSFKGIPQPENVKNELDDDEWETHATVLDKLLAWEKKLCHEVKEFEVIKMTYQRKLAVLNKKKQRGASSSSVEKTKAVVSHLHTKYIVDLQTLESTVAEINRLRDKQLYPKLLELVKGMWHMWDIMYAHHKAQLRIILELKSSDDPVTARETSEQHHERTVQLWTIVQEWHNQFGNFMTYQKNYVGSLYSWIKLNVIPIDTNLKPNSSQPHEATPPIKRLLHAWHDILEKLPDESTKKAIFTFAEVVKTILVHQEELELRIKIEETRREHERRRRQFDDWARKNWDKGAGMNNPDGSLAAPVMERKAAVEKLEQGLKNLEETYRGKCRVVRDKSLNLLRTNLPELFRVVSDFSLQSAGMFKGLWSIAHTNDQLDE